MLSNLLLRGASRGNAANLIKSGRLTPLKAYSTVVTNVNRQALVKPLALPSKVGPIAIRNISVSAPRMAAEGSNHTGLWTIERLVSVGLLAVIPTAFIAPSQVMDALLAISVVIHTHWGVEAMVVDYLRPSVVGNIVPKVAHYSLILMSIAVLGGLFYIIKNDIGLANGIKRFWAIGSNDTKEAPAPPKKSSAPPKK